MTIFDNLASAHHESHGDGAPGCQRCLDATKSSGDQSAVITSRTGRRFLVRILRKGDRYGLDDCLAWGDGSGPVTDDGRLGVEFYDLTYRGNPRFGPRGQFVSRYYVETLIADPDEHRGLNLYGAEPAWVIDAAAMAVVRSWLRHESSTLTQEV